MPVHTALCERRADGAFTDEIGVHCPVAGLKRAPSPALLVDENPPPQMMSSVPVHTAVCAKRADGAFICDSGDHAPVQRSPLHAPTQPRSVDG